MAKIPEPLLDDQVKNMTVINLRNEYIKLSTFVKKVLNNQVIYCQYCGKWRTLKTFYGSDETADGIEHFACKECILNMCTDVDKDGVRTDNKEKTIKTFKRLNWYFNEKDYNAQLQVISDGINEKVRSTAAQQLITMIRSLPNWKGLTFEDSEFTTDEIIEKNNNEKNTKLVQKTLKAARKRFGEFYGNEDLMYLENEYQDWITRYPCENKAQEILFKRICCIQLSINKTQKEGKSTKDLDATLQDCMSSLNIKPSQKNSNSPTDNLTFGQLIDKWEQEKPIPEPDEEFKDIDRIGLYIDVFFKGHLSKMMGLKNAFSSLYERFMAKYTVTKPQYNDEDTDSESLFDKIFGAKIDEV